MANWRVLPRLLALALVAEFLTVTYFDSGKQRMTLSFTVAVVMAAVALTPGLAPLVGVSAALVHVVQKRQWQRGIGRALFNLVNPALAAVIAVGSAQPADRARRLGRPAGDRGRHAGLLCRQRRRDRAQHRRPHGDAVAQIVRDSLWSAPTTLVVGLIGGFVGVMHERLGLLGIGLFVLVLLVLRFTLAFAARKNRQAIVILEEAKAATERRTPRRSRRSSR